MKGNDDAICIFSVYIIKHSLNYRGWALNLFEGNLLAAFWLKLENVI